MWWARGREWTGAYAQVHGDEWLYSAYINALIDGRPRRNDPYTGRDDTPDSKQPESLFSIQFVPSFLIAYPARFLGISAASAFIILGITCPIVSTLAIFWLLWIVSDDHRFAAGATVAVISFGGLAAGVGAVTYLGSAPQYVFLPFLRRYEPAAMFPLFFIFCGLVWKSLRCEGSPTFAWAVSAGCALVVLIFSYFYLWTAAIAWLACVAIVWLCGKRELWLQSIGRLLIIATPGVLALIPYFILLSHRSSTMDSSQQLILSHAPDLFRIPEILGLVSIVLVLSQALRGKVDLRDPRMLFALSFSFAPFAVFNQQIITGRSLQSFHYELFIANYVGIVAVFLSAFGVWSTSHKPTRPMSSGWAVRLILIALWWAAIEVLLHTNTIVRESQFIDSAAAVCARLRKFSELDGSTSVGKGSRPLVLAVDERVAIILPTFAPQGLLWSPNFGLLDLQPSESAERLYFYMYYSGIDSHDFETALRNPSSMLASVAFGPGRNLPEFKTKPPSSEERDAKVTEYKKFEESFSQEKAANHVLSYLIEPAEGGHFTNIDRWYYRDDGEQVGNYKLYRLRLR